MSNPTEDRKAALIAEAKDIGAKIDPNWSVEQLEMVVGKKRATVAAAAKAAAAPPPPPAAVDGDDEDDGAAMRILELEDELKTAADGISALRAELDEVKAANAKLTEKLRISNETVFNLESAKSAVETQLFDLQAKGAGVTENARPTEDFGGPKEPAAPRAAKPTASGMVKCRITKAGAGKVHTGNGNEMFERDAICHFPAETVAALEEKGWAESD